GMVAAKIATLDHGQRQSGQLAAVPTQEQASAMLNVGERTIRRAREDVEQGASELQHAVETGAVAVAAASAIATLPEPEQREVIAKGEKEILDKAKEIRARRAEGKRVERIATIAELSKGNSELGTEQRYPIIYADPPWRYENPPMGGGNRSIE